MKKYKIYQLPAEHKAVFMSMEFVNEHNIMPKLEDYTKVYEGEVEDDTTLDDIYTKFNLNRPEDFKGRSLSTSDVVELDGKYYYCDSFGWEEIKFNNKKSATMKQTTSKVKMTAEEKVYALCVESAKHGDNGYSFVPKEVWQSARSKYKMNKQQVTDALNSLANEGKVNKVNDQPVVVELMPKVEEPEPESETPKEKPKSAPTIEEQWADLKAKHPNALLLFRCGDFYESYNEDAEAVAKTVGITLTTNKDGKRFAGFPHHALDTYLPKLIRAGYRAAICDPLEDPKLVKKISKREAAEQPEVEKEPKAEPKPATGEQNEVSADKLKALLNKKINTTVIRHGKQRELTECEVINLRAIAVAKALYKGFKRFLFARMDGSTKTEYANVGAAKKGKADMDNLLYVIKVAEGVQYAGKTRIEAYQNFLNTIA